MIVTQKLCLVSEEGRKVTWQQIRKLSVINLVFFYNFASAQLSIVTEFAEQLLTGAKFN